MTTLFTLAIPPLPTQDTSIPRTITCTTPSPLIYILTFSSPPDNRLTTPFCQTLILALDILETEHAPGVVITTSSIPKFYSNGLDFEHATSTPGFFTDSMYAVFRRLLTYPMPTISLLNGHAFAGGLMLAMYHDYRLCNPSRGFLCLNELDLGIPLKPAMSSIFRQKLSAPVYQRLVLEALRFNGPTALQAGIVDAVGGIEECLKFIGERKLETKAKTGVYGVLKREMYRETLGYIDGDADEEKRWSGEEGRDGLRKEEMRGKVGGWKSKSKL